MSGTDFWAERTGMLIREEREACGMTQVAMAEALKVSVSAISKWEQGAMKMAAPTYIKIMALFRDKRMELEQATEVTK